MLIRSLVKCRFSFQAGLEKAACAVELTMGFLREFDEGLNHPGYRRGPFAVARLHMF